MSNMPRMYPTVQAAARETRAPRRVCYILRGRPREYVFYIEIDAGREEPACADALTHLATLAQWTRVLGTYART